MSEEFPKLRVAAVQAAPVFLSLEETIEKACDYIRDAGKNNADLISFGESFIPGYPWFIWMGDPSWWMKFYLEMFKNSIVIPSSATDALCDAAKDANTYVMMGATSKFGNSLYCTQIFISKEGKILGIHRKVKPTHLERAVWGEGPGDELQVYDTEIGRIGGLNCWENMMPLIRYVMYSLGEQIHVASWPAFSMQHIGRLFQEDPNVTATRHLAVEGGLFVLNTSQVIGQDCVEILCDTDERNKMLKPGGGWTEIIAPDGSVIAGPLKGQEEGIIYADIDLSILPIVKDAFDPVGHYTRPDIIQAVINLRSFKPFTISFPSEEEVKKSALDVTTKFENLLSDIEELKRSINELKRKK
jgi:predicted amidohydrolase